MIESMTARPVCFGMPENPRCLLVGQRYQDLAQLLSLYASVTFPGAAHENIHHWRHRLQELLNRPFLGAWTKKQPGLDDIQPGKSHRFKIALNGSLYRGIENR